MQHGALLSDVALGFCKRKQLVLLSLRSKFGEGVYVPEFFQIYDFSVADERAAFLTSLRGHHGSWVRVYDFIRERINVISLPVQSGGSWRVALLLNIETWRAPTTPTSQRRWAPSMSSSRCDSAWASS